MRASPSRRPLVVDAYDDAKHYREVFTKKPVTKARPLPFTWPSEMQLVGDSLAVAYESDKWKDEGDFELYKHLAESRNRIFARPGFFYSYERQKEHFRVIGPTKPFWNVPMPRHFAFLALFEEAHFSFFNAGSNQSPRFVKPEAIGRVFVAHGLLGGGKIRWSELDPRAKDQPFLFVYTEPDPSVREPGGVHMIIVGDELDIEADGIVG